MAAKPVAKRRPKILQERRTGYPKCDYSDNIQKRDWSKNRLGKSFLKKPESMKLTKFYATSEERGNYRAHKLLEQKIRHLIKARPFRPHGMQICQGKTGAYYLKMRGISSDKAVWIRVDNERILKAVKFLSE